MALTYADDLTTLFRSRQALGLATGDTGNDTLIENLIDAASHWIQDQCNRKFGRRHYNRAESAAGVAHTVTSILSEPYHYHSGDGRSGVIILPQYPVDSAAITIAELVSRDSTGAGAHTWSSSGYVTGYDYEVDWEKGIVRLLAGAFSSGTKNYRITYEAGYEEPRATGSPTIPWVPEDLIRCCNEVVKIMFDGGGGRVSSESIGTWSRCFDLTKDNPFIEMVLEKYKAISNLL